MANLLLTHRPPHLYFSNTEYFLTVSTYKQQHFINSNSKKDIIQSILNQALKVEEYLLHGWVILDNHIHLLVRTKEGIRLSKFIARITAKSAIELNKLDNQVGRKVWYQYWDRCLRDEKDFYIRLNYIHYNPVKHNYVTQPELYTYSSYQEYLAKYGAEWLNDCYDRYPVKDFSPEKGMEID
ncbi:MAG: transposase [Planctomycetes bacterium]|nr:transposase [Planctomycetota bacterium]